MEIVIEMKKTPVLFCTTVMLFFAYSYSMDVEVISVSASGQFPGDQKALLLELRDHLNYDPTISTKLANWNQSTDCCFWPGVSCDSSGHPVGLDLTGNPSLE